MWLLTAAIYAETLGCDRGNKKDIELSAHVKS